MNDLRETKNALMQIRNLDSQNDAWALAEAFANELVISRSDLTLATRALEGVMPLLSRLIRSDFATDEDFDNARLAAMKARTFLMHTTNKVSIAPNETNP